jgi:CDP-paratose 2-epimerase
MTALMRNERGDRPILITGGAGFIGCNVASALATRGDSVLILDSLARQGARENAHWLKSRHGDRIEIQIGDIREREAVNAAVGRAGAVIHLAAQVAVTTSLEQPLDDFAINAGGTLNVLEAVRQTPGNPPVLFASTNKVYGSLFDDAEMRRNDSRCEPPGGVAHTGISEEAPLDFHSPYGCSKGAADQYVRDYARVFGLRSAVMRMSCIYGPRQFGNEDQGWIAHFFLQAIQGNPITIYGDGLQVRDALHIDDAVAAWLSVLDNIDDVKGRVFNLGGGPENTISLCELLDTIAQLRGERPVTNHAPSRPGDQPWYVSDTRALRAATGWAPQVSLSEGLNSLSSWLESRFGSQTLQAVGAR